MDMFIRPTINFLRSHQDFEIYADTILEDASAEDLLEICQLTRDVFKNTNVSIINGCLEGIDKNSISKLSKEPFTEVIIYDEKYPKPNIKYGEIYTMNEPLILR